MRLIGIDPGIEGAIALIENRETVTFWDMPIVPRSSGHGNEVCAVQLAEILKATSGEVYIEHVQAMRRDGRTQGVTSAFSFGRSFGIIEGVLGGLCRPYHLVRPQRWKKLAGLTKQPKDASRGAALRLYPSAASALTRKKDGGRAEALLIAHFGGI